ncbi:MAG: hypothetical protein IT322_21130 [Anaerolineae bacterium]|nr:hypothetical protein [Anaerolineae bacterium]
MPPTATIRLTLTLPNEESSPDSGTLLIQRGELASIRQFSYTSEADLGAVITEALLAFAALEVDPPLIPDAPPPQAAPQAAPKVTPPTEPMLEIPLKKGSKSVKLSHLQIVGGEDEVTHQHAVAFVGKLIEGKLWDGTIPIRIADVPALGKKLKHLTERDLSMFSLEDLVQVGEIPVITK